MSWIKATTKVLGIADGLFGLSPVQRKVKIKTKIVKLEREDHGLSRKTKTKKRLKRRTIIASQLGLLYERLRNLE